MIQKNGEAERDIISLITGFGKQKRCVGTK